MVVACAVTCDVFRLLFWASVLLIYARAKDRVKIFYRRQQHRTMTLINA